MARLRRVDCSGPGIRRRRRGKGFEYLDADGNRVDDPEVLERIRELVIPPAWEDVWICPYPMGHIQATGVDARGRKQYRYHDRWRERRDQEKFDSMVDFARALPRCASASAADLGDRRSMPRERVLAGAVRLLDRGFFRVGGEDYAVENETYGLATMHKRHVTLDGDMIALRLPGEERQAARADVVDDDVAEIVAALKRRRGGGDELLAYSEGRRWRDVKSADINAYVKEVTGGDFSAKDFRTWNAHAAGRGGARRVRPGRRGVEDRAQARDRARSRRSPTTSATRRPSAAPPTSTRACSTASTPASRSAGALRAHRRDPRHGPLHGKVEEAVLDLIAGDEESAAIERAD